jgi:uroporphyrin-3 C-methyltransferase
MTDKKPASTNANDVDTNKTSASTNSKKSVVAEPASANKLVGELSRDKKSASAKVENKITNAKKSSRKIDKRPIGSRSKNKFILWFVIIFIICVVAAYGAWQFWLVQNVRIQQSAKVSQQQYDVLLATVNEKNSKLQQQLLDQQDQFLLLVQQSSKEQKLQQQRLDAQLAKINTLSGVSRDGWKLEEARHLLRLANQRQLTGSNVSGIVGLLEAADSVLREIDTPELFIIREQIQNDLVALKIAPSVDREGIYLQLNALLSEVTNLPAAPVASMLEEKPLNNADVSPDEPISELSSNNNDAEKGSLSLWEAIVQRTYHTLDSLDRYVRITHHDQPIEPVLSITQQAISQENLRLLLTQAQAALLREESVIYQQSIARTIELLNKNYRHYFGKTAMVVMLDELQEKKIETQLPNVASSLTLLSQYIDTQSSPSSSAVSVTKNPLKNNAPVPEDKILEAKNDGDVKEMTQ